METNLLLNNSDDCKLYIEYHQFQHFSRLYVLPTQCGYVFSVDLGTTSDDFLPQN